MRTHCNENKTIIPRAALLRCAEYSRSMPRGTCCVVQSTIAVRKASEVTVHAAGCVAASQYPLVTK